MTKNISGAYGLLNPNQMSETTWTKNEMGKMLGKSAESFIDSCPEEITPSHVLASPDISLGAKARILIRHAYLETEKEKAMLVDLGRLVLPLYVDNGAGVSPDFAISVEDFLNGRVSMEEVIAAADRTPFNLDAPYRACKAGSLVFTICDLIGGKRLGMQSRIVSLMRLSDCLIRDVGAQQLEGGAPLRELLVKHYSK